MNKIAMLTAIGALGLSGCASLQGGSNLAGADFSKMSCEEITGIFDAYESDKATAKSIGGIVGIFSPSSASLAESTMQSGDAILQTAKVAANVALVSKGCQSKL